MLDKNDVTEGVWNEDWDAFLRLISSSSSSSSSSPNSSKEELTGGLKRTTLFGWDSEDEGFDLGFCNFCELGCGREENIDTDFVRFPAPPPSPSNRELDEEDDEFVGFPLGRGREEKREEEGLVELAPNLDADNESPSSTSSFSPLSKKPVGREGFGDCLGWGRDWKRGDDLGGGREEKKDELLEEEEEGSESSDL